MVCAASTIFQSGWHVLHAERHICLFYRCIYFLKQLAQIGIGFKIKNHKARVNINWFAILINRNRICMTSNVIVLLVYGKVGMPLQKMRSAHPCYAGAYDGGAAANALTP